MKDIDKLAGKVEELMTADSSGHDFWHANNVLNNAREILSDYKTVDKLVVEYAALVHDVADHKFGYDDNDRRKIIKKLLSDLKITEEQIDHIIIIVNTISFSKGIDRNSLSLEAKIVQDADRLDAIGAIGIARTFAYGGAKGRHIFNPNINRNLMKDLDKELQDTIYHFDEKLLHIKNLMNTNKGKELAKERHQFMKVFLEQFSSECNIDTML